MFEGIRKGLRELSWLSYYGGYRSGLRSTGNRSFDNFENADRVDGFVGDEEVGSADTVGEIERNTFVELEHAIRRERAANRQGRRAVREPLDRRRRDVIDLLDTPILGDRDSFQIENRIAGHNAVEVVREVLRHHHALPAAGRAADPIRPAWPVAVVDLDQILGRLRGDVDRTVGVVNDRLRVEKELVRNRQLAVFVPAVLARHSPAVSERRRQCSRGSGGKWYLALGAAATLEHEAAIPIRRNRQAHLKTCRLEHLSGCNRAFRMEIIAEGVRPEQDGFLREREL